MPMSAATTGALAGLIFGLGEYIVVMRMMARALVRGVDSADDAHDLLARRVMKMKWALMCSAFVILPAVGFTVGQAYGN
jgi:hypothetical protein